LNRLAEAIDLLRQRRKLRDDSYCGLALAEALIKAGADAGAEASEGPLRSIN